MNDKITASMNNSVKGRMYNRPINSTFDTNKALIMKRDYAAEIENLDIL